MITGTSFWKYLEILIAWVKNLQIYNLGAGCGGAHSRKSQADLFKCKASQGFKFKATQGDLVSNKTRQRQNKKTQQTTKSFPLTFVQSQKKGEG